MQAFVTYMAHTTALLDKSGKYSDMSSLYLLSVHYARNTIRGTDCCSDNSILIVF